MGDRFFSIQVTEKCNWLISSIILTIQVFFNIKKMVSWEGEELIILSGDFKYENLKKKGGSYSYNHYK